MIFIHTNIFGASLTFVIGLVIAFLSFLFSKYMLKKHASKYAISQALKQMVQVLYLVAIYFLYSYTPWSLMWLLAGGALGITVPMFYFTYKLVKLNDLVDEKEDE